MSRNIQESKEKNKSSVVPALNNLPRVVTWQQNGQELNQQPLDYRSNTLNITSHNNTTRKYDNIYY